MAIWQFQIVLIPQQKSEIDFQSIFRDEGYDVSHFWYFFNKKLELIQDIETLLDRNSQWWDQSSFCWGDDKRTDINLDINEQSNCIENLRIRIDVREQFDLAFIEKLINLAKKYHLLLINIGEKKMIGLNVKDIYYAMINSKAYQFKNL